jgi:malonyl-CoA/methylmalonyl-CoA synthetase
MNTHRMTKPSTTTTTNTNLYAQLAANFPADTQACAIEAFAADGTPRYFTWQDIDHATAKLANLLTSLNLPAGARVAAQTEKSVEALLLYLATLRAGFVYLPLNTAYQHAEMDYFIGNAEPSVVVCDPRNLSWIAPLCSKHGVRWHYTLGAQPCADEPHSLLAAAAPMEQTCTTVHRQASDLAAILYTSGTTGRSKGAMLSHGNLWSNALTLKRVWGWQEGDVLLHVLPIFHVHGLFVASHGALANGSKMIWLAKFEPQTVVALLKRSTVFMGVPTLYTRLLAEPSFTREACRNMRLFISGSAPLLIETFNAFIARTGHTILERYGMSETVMLTSNPCVGERRGGTVGLPLPGVQVRVRSEHGADCASGEIGNIEVKGPNVFSGYWRMPEKTRDEFTADGFFKTGDVGCISVDGYVTIAGRSKDLIITGGYNVYPAEVEGFINELPGVDESAVIGVPHPDFGEGVVAVVVLKSGASIVADGIAAALKKQIANYKVPKRVLVVADLPRNAMGKVQKNLLRETYQALFQPE